MHAGRESSGASESAWHSACPPVGESQDMNQLADMLVRRRAEILRDWEERVLKDPEVPAAKRLPEPALRDHIPNLLDEMIASLREGRSGCGEATVRLRFGKTVLPESHAQLREQSGYTMHAALRELSLLRMVVLDFAAREKNWECASFTLFHAALDECISVSAAEMQRRANQSLATERELRERFIAVLAHDLRSPLSNIVMAAELVLKQRPLEPQARSLQRVLRAAHRIERMIGDLLDFAEARSGQFRVRRTPGDIHEASREIVENVRAAHPDRELVYEATGDGRGAWDADRLAQMLSNLVDNALSYGPHGGPVAISVRDGDDAGSVVIAVHNGGQPIPSKELPHLFEPFRRGAPSPKRGLGLGLYIASEIAKAHGGAIDVRSDESEGTTFEVRLLRER
jgi:signal transduction histidine kinase